MTRHCEASVQKRTAGSVVEEIGSTESAPNLCSQMFDPHKVGIKTHQLDHHSYDDGEQQVEVDLAALQEQLKVFLDLEIHSLAIVLLQMVPEFPFVGFFPCRELLVRI